MENAHITFKRIKVRIGLHPSKDLFVCEKGFPNSSGLLERMLPTEMSEF